MKKNTHRLSTNTPKRKSNFSKVYLIFNVVIQVCTWTSFLLKMRAKWWSNHQKNKRKRRSQIQFKKMRTILSLKKLNSLHLHFIIFRSISLSVSNIQSKSSQIRRTTRIMKKQLLVFGKSLNNLLSQLKKCFTTS